MYVLDNRWFNLQDAEVFWDHKLVVTEAIEVASQRHNHTTSLAPAVPGHHGDDGESNTATLMVHLRVTNSSNGEVVRVEGSGDYGQNWGDR